LLTVTLKRWDLGSAAVAVVDDLAGVAKAGRALMLTDVGKGAINFKGIFSAIREPRNYRYCVEHDDAPDDETVNVTSPRPRNPAGSANTAWVSRKFLANVQLRRRWDGSRP
jgi:sugar phosphate isomerase/epimerase